MSRKSRKESSTQIYHVILRGNNKQLLFCDDADREFFIGRVFKYSKQLGISIYSYCLMGNHVHILLGNAPKSLLSLFVQKLANSYVYFFNHKYDCCGHLFQGRFLSEPVEDEVYLKNLLRYILNNPQKAQISKMADYKWSTYNELIDLKIKTQLNRDFIIDLFGSIKILKKYLMIPDKKEYLEYENKPSFSDYNASLYIQKLLRVDNLTYIRRLPVEEQKIIMKQLKSHKFSVAQLIRVTGVPRGIILTA